MITEKISPGNKSLKYIDIRIQDEKYRGAPSSEHNRYNMDKIFSILSLLDKYAPEKSLMIIRTTDISKRSENTDEEIVYSHFCNDAKQSAGIGTQDAMRKNIFVDLHRMGFIKRYNKNEELINPFSRSSVKYVSISEQGLKFIRSKNILDKYFIFSKGIDRLLGGHIDVIFNILRDGDYGIDSISVYEYMFFISAIGVDTDFNINTDTAVELIKNFRNLTAIQKKSVLEVLRKELKPKNFSGSKLNKRDFGNWKNKIDQIFHLLDQTVYFERRGEQLVLKSGENSFKEVSTKLDRSLNEKYQYFVKQEVEKSLGFELHHVVPLSWSESIHHFKMLDKWENMVYIDAYSHAKITQNKNRNIVLNVIDNDISLSDYISNTVYLKYKENILYKPDNKNIMKNYNQELINVIK